MEIVATSVIAVVGTLLGSASTYLFQRRATRRAEWFARTERLRQERLDAYCALGGALANYRRGQLDYWFAHHARRSPGDVPELKREAQRLRTVALEAMFRVRLLTEDTGTVDTAQRALRSVDRLYYATDRDELDRGRDASRSLIDEFVTASKSGVALPQLP
ncbi:hypothetical protein E0L36_17960 [Streptomyces sp. AJS327]|uniref:hypothetical protein n=1 Tax=Streptomyces sp. AJS327 TaxID=2545265 RepID=UPI0015DEE6DE|nr:hypothetical protein [Streptomyces sp. AJS327]MBA0052694.1 hypothetical protein [Streptomyces sp. AJS327]